MIVWGSAGFGQAQTLAGLSLYGIKEMAGLALNQQAFNPRTYTEAQERAARQALVDRYYEGGAPIQAAPVKPLELVTIVAKALGLERAS